MPKTFSSKTKDSPSSFGLSTQRAAINVMQKHTEPQPIFTVNTEFQRDFPTFTRIMAYLHRLSTSTRSTIARLVSQNVSSSTTLQTSQTKLCTIVGTQSKEEIVEV